MLIVDTTLSITSFGLDENNELYFTSFDGKIYQLTQSADVTAPTIGAPLQVPLNPILDEEVEITVNVSDTSGLREATLSYRNDSLWNNVSMKQIAQGTFHAVIPPMPYRATVEYMMIAYDKIDNTAVSNNQGLLYRYTVIPELPSGTLVAFFVGATVLTGAIMKKRKRTFRRLISMR